jgi:hypothetical protein
MPKTRDRTRLPLRSSLGRGRREGRQRLSIEPGPEAIDNIERLHQMHGEITNTQVISRSGVALAWSMVVFLRYVLPSMVAKAIAEETDLRRWQRVAGTATQRMERVLWSGGSTAETKTYPE